MCRDSGEIEGKPIGESFVNVYEGERLIFVGRTLDETGEVTYVLAETDFVTGKRKVYGVKLAEERDLPDEQLEAVTGGCDAENDRCPHCNGPARIKKMYSTSIPCAYVVTAEHTALTEFIYALPEAIC